MGELCGYSGTQQNLCSKQCQVKITKYGQYLNTPKNEEMQATEVMPYTVRLVEYKDEVDTTPIVNGTILGVQQAFKSPSEANAAEKSVSKSCNLINLPINCKANWVLCTLVKLENCPKDLQFRMDNNTTTLVQLTDPAIHLA